MKVFLFPLPKISYVPNIRKPLNIFEPRYIEMVEEAVRTNTPIALCYGCIEGEDKIDTIDIVHESLTSVKKISGCGIPKILQRSPIGKELLIILVPYSKIEIEKTLESDTPYIVAKAREINEFETILPENTLLLKRIELEFRKWAKAYFKEKEQYDNVIEALSDPPTLIASYIEFIVQSPALKQAVLELDDINDRLKFLCEDYQ